MLFGSQIIGILLGEPGRPETAVLGGGLCRQREDQGQTGASNYTVIYFFFKNIYDHL